MRYSIYLLSQFPFSWLLLASFSWKMARIKTIGTYRMNGLIGASFFHSNVLQGRVYSTDITNRREFQSWAVEVGWDPIEQFMPSSTQQIWNVLLFFLNQLSWVCHHWFSIRMDLKRLKFHLKFWHLCYSSLVTGLSKDTCGNTTLNTKVVWQPNYIQ